jgi:hypothetical protein
LTLGTLAHFSHFTLLGEYVIKRLIAGAIVEQYAELLTGAFLSEILYLLESIAPAEGWFGCRSARHPFDKLRAGSATGESFLLCSLRGSVNRADPHRSEDLFSSR